MSRRFTKKHNKSTIGTKVQKKEEGMSRTLDDLADFEHFRENILPLFFEDLKNGMDERQLFDKYRNYMTAILMSRAITEEDTQKKLAAYKELRDRMEGKAVERQQVSHQYEGLSEEEIDALLTSRINEISDEKH